MWDNVLNQGRRISFPQRDDCSLVHEGADFLMLFTIHLDHDLFHLLAAEPIYIIMDQLMMMTNSTFQLFSQASVPSKTRNSSCLCNNGLNEHPLCLQMSDRSEALAHHRHATRLLGQHTRDLEEKLSQVMQEQQHVTSDLERDSGKDLPNSTVSCNGRRCSTNEGGQGETPDESC